MSNRSWSPAEVAAAVQSYLDMLEREIVGVAFATTFLGRVG